MRAKGALTVVCALFGAAAIAAHAEASETRSQARQIAAQPAAEQAQPRATTARQVQSRAAAPRQAKIAPQQQAQSALAMPAVARGLQLTGTPILPVSVTSGLSCVPFARMATGMNISGDARMWWHNAAGSYARGQVPERGAVLAFMATGGMSRGHVAVVSRVVNARTIQIDHANWGGPGIRRGTVMRGATVVDVSDRNDWTAVRVQVGHSAENFGRTYATHGFIYNRPAGSRILTAGAAGTVEVAEAPSPHAAQHLRRMSEVFAE